MTAATTASSTAPTSTSGGRGNFLNFAKATGVVAGVLGAGALALNNGANMLGDTVGGISDASNIKVAASSVLLAGAGMLGLAVEHDQMGRRVAPTAVGIGSAAVAGFALGNMFTGGYFEEGSIAMGAAGAALATGYSAASWYKNRRTAGRTATPRTGRVSGAWNTVKDKFNGLSSRNKKIVSGLGAGAATLAVTEASNALNWPFGGFNHVGAVVSAGVVSAATVFGERIKDKVGDLNIDHPVAIKIGGAVLSLAALGVGLYAWNKGVIGGHSGGKGGASEHVDKVAPKGNGSSSTVTSTMPSTTSGNSVSTTIATAPPATPVPGGGGSQFTYQSFMTANKANAVAKIQQLQPGISADKASGIADQILSGQYETVSNSANHDSLVHFFTTATQQQADSMFAHDVSVLAAA